MPFSPAHAAESGALYAIAGKHSAYGAYHGQLELRADGSATRVVEYDSFRFDGFRVQEVWTGTGAIDGKRLSLSFPLRQADFLSIADDQKRTSEQFLLNLPVSYALANDSRATFTLPNGTYEESAVGAPRATDASPLWKNERQNIASFGDSNPILGGVLFSTAFKPLLDRYHDEPVVKASLAKPQCQSQNQWIVRDPTDFEFLRAHPDTIRVANKVSDRIAFVEASLRANAYGPTLAAKAAAFDEAFPRLHLNPYGFFSWAVVEGDGATVKQYTNGDSALFTGTYAGSQAMRWLVTKDPAALANFKRATSALMLAMDITGDPRTFARTVAPLEPGEVVSGDWHAGTGPYQGVKYLMPGNNDMIKGLFHAFAWALEILPEGDPFLEQVKAHAARLPELKSLRDTIPFSENRYLAEGLAALATGSYTHLGTFTALFFEQEKPRDYFNLERGFYYGGSADWSGQNLLMVSMVSRVLIANGIRKRFGSSMLGVDSTMLAEARRILMETWAVYASAKRDALTVAAFTFGQQNLLGMTAYTAPRSWPKMESWNANVSQTVWSLREIPITAGPHQVAFDNTLRADGCMSYWPAAAWQVFAYQNPMSHYYQAKSLYPYFEGAALHMENLWSADFEVQGAGGAHVRPGRFDYLFLYWMSRLSGLVDAGA